MLVLQLRPVTAEKRRPPGAAAVTIRCFPNRGFVLKLRSHDGNCSNFCGLAARRGDHCAAGAQAPYSVSHPVFDRRVIDRLPDQLPARTAKSATQSGPGFSLFSAAAAVSGGPVHLLARFPG